MSILGKNVESTRKGWYWYEKAAMLLCVRALALGFENIMQSLSKKVMEGKEAVLVLVIAVVRTLEKLVCDKNCKGPNLYIKISLGT